MRRTPRSQRGLPRTCWWVEHGCQPGRLAVLPRQSPLMGAATRSASILSVGCWHDSILGRRRRRRDRVGGAPGPGSTAQAVIDLLGVIAYGELSAFERLAEDARLAPTLDDKLAMVAHGVGRVRATSAPLRARIEALGADAVRGDGAVPDGHRRVPRAHGARRLVRGAGQGVRRRRPGRRLLPRDRRLPRPGHPRRDHRLARATSATRRSSSTGSAPASRPTRGSAAGSRCGAAA